MERAQQTTVKANQLLVEMGGGEKALGKRGSCQPLPAKGYEMAGALVRRAKGEGFEPAKECGMVVEERKEVECGQQYPLRNCCSH